MKKILFLILIMVGSKVFAQDTTSIFIADLPATTTLDSAYLFITESPTTTQKITLWNVKGQLRTKYLDTSYVRASGKSYIFPSSFKANSFPYDSLGNGVFRFKTFLQGATVPDSSTINYTIPIWKKRITTWQDSVSVGFGVIDNTLKSLIVYTDTSQAYIESDTLKLHSRWVTVTGNGSINATGKTAMTINYSDTVTSISGGIDGKEIIITNIAAGGGPIRFNETGNIVNLPADALVLNTYGVVRFKYNAILSKWICTGVENN